MLTDTECKNAVPPALPQKTQKLTDGGGLYLEVFQNGRKSWGLKYRFASKEKRLSLGTYPTVTLKQARELRDDAKKLLAQKIDPAAVKHEVKRELLKATDNRFHAVAKEWFETNQQKWKTTHATRTWGRLEVNVFPELGNRPISKITAPELLAVLRMAETRGSELAHRVLQICSQVFLYAIITGRAERNPATDLKGALKPAIKEHYVSLKASELPEFIQTLDQYTGRTQTQLAMKLLIHTFLRNAELIAGQWSEIDFDTKIWTIPSARMKMKKEHVVPLSPQSIDILHTLKEMNTQGSSYVFPQSSNPTKHMGSNTLLDLIYRLGFRDKATVHGFRSTSSTFLNESGFRPDVIERQLAHVHHDKVRASYNFATYLPDRRQMMDFWSHYLDSLAEGQSNVVMGKFG